MIFEHNALFEEERTCPCVSRLLDISEDTWYKTIETYSDEYTYSVIELPDNMRECSSRQRVLLIGINPRQAVRGEVRSIQEEVEKYLSSRETNPNIKFRPGLNCCIEKCRANILADIIKSGISIKELVTVDLFSHRTYNSAELIRIIQNNPDSLGKIIGNLNIDCIKYSIENSDIIVLAWGRIEKKLWGSITGYRDEIYKLLYERIDKCLWYGPTRNGSPLHASAYVNKQLKPITEDELKKAMSRI